MLSVVAAEAEEEDEAEEAEEVEKIPPPPGVTIRDVELFKKVQQTTAEVGYICFSLSSLSVSSIFDQFLFPSIDRL